LGVLWVNEIARTKEKKRWPNVRERKGLKGIMVFSLFIIRVSFPLDFAGESDGGRWEEMKMEGVMWWLMLKEGER